MKSFVYYWTALIIAFFELVDIFLASFRHIEKDIDIYIDPSTQTSMVGMTYTGQFIVFGIVTLIIIAGVIKANAEDKKYNED